MRDRVDFASEAGNEADDPDTSDSKIDQVVCDYWPPSFTHAP